MRSSQRVIALTFLILPLLSAPGYGQSRYESLLATESGRETLKDLALFEDQRFPGDGKLFEYLKSPDALIRLRAVEVVGRIQDPVDVPRLLSLLSDPDTRVVDETIFALGQMGDEQVVARLKALLQGAETQRVALVAEALGKIGGPAAVEILVELLRDFNSGNRGEAALALARAAEPSSVNALLIAIHDPDPKVAWKSIYALERIESNRVGSQLLEFLEDEDHRVRAATARTLGKHKYSKALDPLIGMLNDRDPHVLVNSAWALGELGKKKAVDALGALGAKSDWSHVRRAAVEAIGKIGDKKGKDYLLQRLLDPSAGVRVEATKALAEIMGKDISLFADQMLSDGSPYVRAAMLRSLGIGGAEERIDFLKETARSDKSTLMRAAAIDGLAKFNPETVGAFLVSRLADEDWAVAASAAAAIGECGYQQGIPEMVQIYRDRGSREETNIRMEILRAFEKLQPASAVDLLQQNLDDPDVRIRTLSSQILDMLEVSHEPLAPPRSFFVAGADRTRRRKLSPPLGIKHAVITTERGEIEMELFGDDAIQVTASFLHLVSNGFYNGLRFHRVAPNHVIQGGDPRGDGWGDAGYNVRSEFNQHRYDFGFVGIAHDGKDTGGSQFFIALTDRHYLDGRYTVFGRVTRGMDIAWKVDQGESMTIRIVD